MEDQSIRDQPQDPSHDIPTNPPSDSIEPPAPNPLSQLSSILTLEPFMTEVLREHLTALQDHDTIPPQEGPAVSRGSIERNRRAGSRSQSRPPPTDSESEESSQMFDDLATTIELQVVWKWLESNIAYLVLFLIFFIHQHRIGLLIFVWLATLLYRTNQSIKNQVALKEKRDITALLGIQAIIVAHLLSTYLLFHKDLFRSLLLVLLPRQQLNFWDALWVIAMNDTMVRFAAMLLKCVFIMSARHPHPRFQKRRKQMYALIELMSNLYRLFLPTSVWTAFFCGGEFTQPMSLVLTGMYFSLKFRVLKFQTEVFLSAIKAFVLNRAQYGRYATSEEIAEAGETMCSICQDKMNFPIILACNHMFCDECVTEWFEREKTCPICRAEVKTAGNHSYSDGGTSMLIQLF